MQPRPYYKPRLLQRQQLKRLREPMGRYSPQDEREKSDPSYKRREQMPSAWTVRGYTFEMR